MVNPLPGISGDWWDTGIFTNPDAQQPFGGSQPTTGGGGSQPRSGPDWGRVRRSVGDFARKVGDAAGQASGNGGNGGYTNIGEEDVPDGWDADDVAYEANTQDNESFDEPDFGTTFRGPKTPGHHAYQPPAPVNQGGGSSYAGAGEDAHEKETRDEIHDIHSDLHQQGGLARGIQGRNDAFAQGHSGGPRASGTQRPPTMLEQFGAQRDKALARSADSHANLQNAKARAGAQFAQRQSASQAARYQPSPSGNGTSAGTSGNGGVTQTGTGNGMGATTSEASMSGILPGTPMRPASGIGQSSKTFANTRFRSQ